MAETRGKFDADFKEGAVRLVRETGKPMAQVARELGIVPGTLENWVAKDRRQREGGNGRAPLFISEAVRRGHRIRACFAG